MRETPTEFLQPVDVQRAALGRITAAAVRAAALRGELRTAAQSPRGVRMFAREDVDAFLARRGIEQESGK